MAATSAAGAAARLSTACESLSTAWAAESVKVPQHKKRWRRSQASAQVARVVVEEHVAARVEVAPRAAVDRLGASAASSTTSASDAAGILLREAAVEAGECLEVAGRAQLSGHVRISGAKNSALVVLAGALLCPEEVVLRSVPRLQDIRRMGQLLQSVGAKFQHDGHTAVIDASTLTSSEPRPDTVRQLRASFFVIGALLARTGEAVLPLPGGCNIGARPIDLHVRGLQALGADVQIKHGRVHAKASKLTGASFYLDFPSVGATETLMMAAVLAEGESVFANVAQEPEVVDLANFLISMGAQIKGAGTNCIVVNGVKKLHPAEFTIIPDRIEAGTFLVAGAITNSSFSLGPVIPQHLTAVISKLQASGCSVVPDGSDWLRIIPTESLRAVDITTLPYPGFPTDMQPQFMSLLVHAQGVSTVRETVFEKRMRHAEELQRLGANIKLSGSAATIYGRLDNKALWGAPVTATDLRAGAALVLAGMAAEGITTIDGLEHIDRGYERLDEKLRSLGADIRRVPRPRSVEE